MQFEMQVLRMKRRNEMGDNGRDRDLAVVCVCVFMLRVRNDGAKEGHGSS